MPAKSSKKSAFDAVFIQTAVHDLKAPILAAKLFLEMVLDPKGDALTKAQRENLEEVARSNAQLLAMVQDMLAMMTLEKGGAKKTERALVEVREVTQELLKELGPSLSQKKIIVRWVGKSEACPPILSHAARMKQALHNLLTNAVKYNRVGGLVTLGVEELPAREITVPPLFQTLRRALQKKKSWCVITVQDGGVGIPEKEQAQVFDRLFRASNARQIDAYGTGLGLYLTKLLVEGLGGCIWFSSEEGKGTAFSIALPFD